MPNILDRYAHDYRDMKMSEKELKLLLKLFVMELLPKKQGERWASYERVKALGHNQLRQEIIERIGGE